MSVIVDAFKKEEARSKIRVRSLFARRSFVSRRIVHPEEPHHSHEGPFASIEQVGSEPPDRRCSGDPVNDSDGQMSRIEGRALDVVEIASRTGSAYCLIWHRTPGPSRTNREPIDYELHLNKGDRAHGEDAKDKASTLQSRWVFGVNNLGAMGR